MKSKNILIIILVALLSFNIGYFLSRSTLYPETGIITEVNKISVDTYDITFETVNGHKWNFYSEDSDWFVGDIISLIMNNSITENIIDDEIIDCKYSGTIEMYKIKEK